MRVRSFLRLNRTLVILIVSLLGTLASSASSGGQPGRIGWVYRIEGQLDGHPVLYVGSAADLKQRLSNAHKWSSLLTQEDTRVYALEVFANLDVRASNRQTLLSARTEALRAAEQRALEQVRERVQTLNRQLAPGEKEAKVLNEMNASLDAPSWEARHQVTTSSTWQLLERRIAGTTTRLVTALTLLDVFWMYRETQLTRYVMAPYVLGDEQGFFTLEQSSSLIATSYHKTYLSGSAKDQRLELSASDFNALKEEAEALWGTTDWKGEFVPGLLNRTLPRVTPQDSTRL